MDQPTTSSPQNSFFSGVPDELIVQIDRFLSFDDSFAFMHTCRRVYKTLQGNFSGYDQLQLSDEPNDCYIRDSKSRKRARKIRDTSVPWLFSKTDSIREVMIVVKEVDAEKLLTTQQSHSPFAPGGYLASFLGKSLSRMESVKTVNVHIDMMLESFKNTCLPCPMQDLFYALDVLSTAKFETFVQISLCCAEFSENDTPARNFLISGMEQALKAAHLKEAEGEFVAEYLEGYVDITVQKGNVEYSFAFFYYNPSICDATEEENGENEEEIEEEEGNLNLNIDSLNNSPSPVKRSASNLVITPIKKPRFEGYDPLSML